jgi:hypothetical protein
MKIGVVGEGLEREKAHNEDNEDKRVGEGVEWKSTHSPKAPNELNCASSRLIPLDTFHPNNEGLNRAKNHLTLLSL